MYLIFISALSVLVEVIRENVSCRELYNSAQMKMFSGIRMKRYRVVSEPKERCR